MKLVIGLIGEQGAGKETVGSLLLHYAGMRSSGRSQPITAVRQRFSDVLGETLDLWGISRTREHLQNLAVAMDGAYGKGTLTAAVKHRALTTKEDVVILDGVRWQTDFDMIRSLPNHLLVYVTADQRKRYERVIARKGAGAKIGETQQTFEEFCVAETRPNEVLIPQLGKLADFVLDNNDDWAVGLGVSWALSCAIGTLFDTAILPKLGSPVP